MHIAEKDLENLLLKAHLTSIQQAGVLLRALSGLFLSTNTIAAKTVYRKVWSYCLGWSKSNTYVQQWLQQHASYLLVTNFCYPSKRIINGNVNDVLLFAHYLRKLISIPFFVRFFAKLLWEQPSGSHVTDECYVLEVLRTFRFLWPKIIK